MSPIAPVCAVCATLLLCINGWLVLSENTVLGKPLAYDYDMVRIAIWLDANKNRALEDEEILVAVRLWITGDRVQGADQVIADGMLMKLIQLWISGETMPVCA